MNLSKNIEDIKINQEIMKTDIKYLRQFIEDGKKRCDIHLDEYSNFKTKIDEITVGGNVTNKALIDKLSEHIVWDKWLFGIIVGLLLFVGGKILTIQP